MRTASRAKLFRVRADLQIAHLIMKSSKYSKEPVLNDNDFSDYQNVSSILEIGHGPKNKSSTRAKAQYANINNSEEVLLNNAFDAYAKEEALFGAHSPESNANRYPGQDFELVCNCAIKNVVYPYKTLHQCGGEHNAAANARSCCSTPKLGERTCSQLSLDKKNAQTKYQKNVFRHSHDCHRGSAADFRKNTSLKRIQSPEIINTHLGPNNFFHDAYGSENCTIKSYDCDKNLQNDDYGFRKGPSFKGANERFVYAVDVV